MATITGTANNDVDANALKGLEGQDNFIYGLAGNDEIYGSESGWDGLIGGPGADYLDGKGGFDSAAYIGSSAGVTVDLGTGSCQGGDAQGDVLVRIEQVVGSAKADKLYAADGQSSWLRGAAGNDLLDGGTAIDHLFGDAGKDRVIGRGAADDLSGGAGADKFVYLAVADSATGAADRIRDFSHGEHDKLDLAAIDAKAAAGGNQAFSFIGQADFSHAGQVRFEVINGHTVVQASTDGDTQAEFEIVFDNNVHLQAGDFIL